MCHLFASIEWANKDNVYAKCLPLPCNTISVHEIFSLITFEWIVFNGTH